MAIEDDLSARLDELEEALRAPWRVNRRRRWEATSRLLAARGFEFRRSVETLRGKPASAMVVARALADLTILTLWIERCPKLHTVLWAAESDRLAQRDVEALANLAAIRGLAPQSDRLPSPAARGRIERANERYRRVARLAGLPISRRPGYPLLPSSRQQVQALPLSELEMYDVAFRTPSAWAHSAAYTMPFESVGAADGITIVPDLSVRHEIVRRLAIALQAAQYAVVSRLAGLGIEDELDVIRRIAMVAPQGA
jgi:hypothetical protein